MVCIEFHGVVSDEQWEAYLRRLQAIQDEAHAQRKKLVLVVDALHATSPVTASQRRLQAEQIAHNADRQVLLGMAAVIDRPLIRGALTALLWIQRFDWDYTVVGTREAAELWALDKLAHEARRRPT